MCARAVSYVIASDEDDVYHADHADHNLAAPNDLDVDDENGDAMCPICR